MAVLHASGGMGGGFVVVKYTDYLVAYRGTPPQIGDPCKVLTAFKVLVYL